MNRRSFLLGAISVAAGGLLSACGASSPSSKSSVSTTSSSVSQAPTTAKASTTTLSDGPAAFFSRGTKADRVALTFHCSGDVALVERMLAKLRALRVSATVFAVGQWLEQNPSMAKKMVDQRLEMANHTYSHRTLASLSEAAIATEIVKCRDVLRSQIGSGGAWFRPSGTENGVDRPIDAIQREAGKAGYATVIGYDVDPLDYQDSGASAVVERVKKTVTPGSIVSLHFGHQGTVDAIDWVVADLRGRGLEPGTVTSVLV